MVQNIFRAVWTVFDQCHKIPTGLFSSLAISFNNRPNVFTLLMPIIFNSSRPKASSSHPVILFYFKIPLTSNCYWPNHHLHPATMSSRTAWKCILEAFHLESSNLAFSHDGIIALPRPSNDVSPGHSISRICCSGVGGFCGGLAAPSPHRIPTTTTTSRSPPSSPSSSLSSSSSLSIAFATTSDASRRRGADRILLRPLRATAFRPRRPPTPIPHYNSNDIILSGSQ